MTALAGWFVLGFFVGAAVCHGPMLAKSVWLNMRSSASFNKASKMLGKYNDLQTEMTKVQEECLSLQKRHGVLQDQMIAVQEEHLGVLRAYHVALEKLKSLGQL